MIRLSKLQSVLNYQFKQQKLLEQALTHRSYSKKNNERLEFLGDSILGVIISESLFHHFTNDNEGKLSRYRAALVKEETLADIAKELNLGDYLFLGSGELKSGGFKRASILSDAFEAVLGAVLLDSDFETVKKLVLKCYQGRIEKVNQLILKDPKSRLQEWLQAKQIPLAQYEVLKITGKEHQQTFTVQCDIEQLKLQVSASGQSRRAAEQQAADIMLSKLNNYA